SQIIIHHWIRTFNIQLGWIKDFDKFVVNYASSFIYTVFMFEIFYSSSKLINTFTGHTSIVWSIDYSTFGDCQFIYSGSEDKTVRVITFNNVTKIQSILLQSEVFIYYAFQFFKKHECNYFHFFKQQSKMENIFQCLHSIKSNKFNITLLSFNQRFKKKHYHFLFDKK
ncbi:WD-40 repeat protein, partial [Reticulomyxa filosa]